MIIIVELDATCVSCHIELWVVLSSCMYVLTQTHKLSDIKWSDRRIFTIHVCINQLCPSIDRTRSFDREILKMRDRDWSLYCLDCGCGSFDINRDFEMIKGRLPGCRRFDFQQCAQFSLGNFYDGQRSCIS